ncbi:Winged helix-like DNA-binding domain superfamily [Sergentomyia squamirostris]
MDKSKIPREYLPLFEDIDVFNEMQSQVFEDCVNMDSSIVVSAPTGSGKTTVFLFTAMRELMNQNWPHEKNVFRLIYIAPTRALVTETFEKWEEKFNKINIKCFEVTGETDITDLRELEEYHVLLTTPEKWDSLTRRWKENANFLKTVRLMMIDEIHLLNEERRGAVLETIICRTKIAALKSESVVRFIGISATLVNVEDVAKWFDVKNTKAHSICNNNSHGSKVNEEIVGVLLSAEESYFKVDAIMNSWVPEIVADNWKNQSTLIFCCTRMSAEITAKALLKNFPLTLELNQTNILENVSQQIENQDLRECLKSGYAFHHGGLNSDDRQIVEHLYRSGIISILICTQTLAMGVNLPTYLVIVKAPNPISPTEMLQMIGRAGRIGHRDDGGVAVIITRTCHAVSFFFFFI